ncbi:hypothetical protein BX600DRAFT_548421 [Xylariales sp. PMI_506]|nr:hypothetical protein BX600DRAFT_548421 [Xylariales sp. PMI_506]
MPPITPSTSVDTNISNSQHSGFIISPRHVRSRTQSISSDRPSTTAYSLMTPPLSVSPEAAFIAASAASQIVTNDHDSHAGTWYDQAGVEPADETALVSVGALQLANNFMDQLLYNIIAVARSTALGALRPAVADVLKPKLAKEAISQADEELREYLGGGEIEDLAQSPTTLNPRDWDLELVWKRTRLRCMVYSSLGDMEEEDEDYYMEQEHLGGDDDDALSEAVSPAVAIFLTSILEYMGEQVLVVAGQAAFNRLRSKYEKELKDGTRAHGDVSDRIVVEELDIERVALDRTLGRLWRSWKKRIRSPVEPNFSRPFSRSTAHSRHGSVATDTAHPVTPPEVIAEPMIGDEAASSGEPKAETEPHSVPLPLGDNDVEEIEVPGLASYSDNEDSDEEEESLPVRPKSFGLFQGVPFVLEEPSPSSELEPVTATVRKRSNSAPHPVRPRWRFALTEEEAAEAVEPEAEASPDSHGAAVAGGASDEIEANVADEKQDEDLPSAGSERQAVQEAPAVKSPRSKPVPAPLTVATALSSEAPMVPKRSATRGEPSPIEEEFEEAQILTSARVSISGASTGSSGEAVRPVSMLPTRSNSVHSIRVIDVQGARSPSLRSRNGSFDIQDTTSSARLTPSLSREGSIATPPIVEEGDAEVTATKSSNRNASIVSSPSESRDPRSTLLQSPSIVTNVSKLSQQFNAPVAGPNVTKVTILNNAPVRPPASTPPPPAAPRGPGHSFLDLDTKPEAPEKAPGRYREPTMASVPEAGSPRQSPAQSAAPIGIPSVDRTQSNVRGSPESPKTVRSKPNGSPSSSSSKYKPMRSSEDSGTFRSQDVARNFEELLQNNQTIQYTLTPENMRNIDVGTPYPPRSDLALTSQQSNRSVHETSPVLQHKPRKSEDVKHTERSRSSSLKRSLSLSKSNGLSSHPVDHQASSRQNPKLSGPVPRAPPVSMANYTRTVSGGLARDARIPRESVSDFADFIRSTGPSGAERGQPPKSRAVGGSTSQSRTVSGPPVTSQYQSSTSNRPRLQARDAAVSASNDSSELIDFIRRGPPSTGNNPRIPRNVAPFRSTMDSDQLQMSAATGGKAVDAIIPDIRHSQASSIPSSVNSQSALLSKAKKPAQYSNNFDEDDMMPQRKQRRVRDPYAIDFSDEEDDDLDIIPKPKPRKEESLIDFLNNYEPPSNPTPPQPFAISRAPQPAPKKKSSAPNLITRFRPGGASVSGGSRSGNGVPDTKPTAQPAKSRGYTPINVNIPTGASFSPEPRVANTSAPRVPMKKFEPREASSGTSRTGDLALFLRDSEPPPSAMASLPPPPAEKSNGLSRVFDRRKKSSVY